jgi:hypothetical protein
MPKAWICFFCFLLALPAMAQIGGKRTFQALELPNNAKMAALGGVNISAFSPEVSMWLANPALLNPEMHHQLALSYTNFISSIGQSSLAYAWQTEKYGLWGAGLNYINYGTFTQRDAAGQEEGKFSVNDYVVSLAHASTIGPFTLGATAKLAVTGIAEYKAVAVLTDIGGIFKHPENDLTVGLVIKNIGYQIKSFSGEREPMPLNVQLGFTYKPEHMPLRFSITAHHLQQFDIVYLDTTGSALINQVGGNSQTKKALGDKIARHFVVGGELLLSKNFNLRFGYNHLRRKELRMENAGGSAGFSLGTMIRIKGFQLDYARGFYHTAGSTNYFTVSSNLQRLFKPKTRKTSTDNS